MVYIDFIKRQVPEHALLLFLLGAFVMMWGAIWIFSGKMMLPIGLGRPRLREKYRAGLTYDGRGMGGIVFVAGICVVIWSLAEAGILQSFRLTSQQSTIFTVGTFIVGLFMCALAWMFNSKKS